MIKREGGTARKGIRLSSTMARGTAALVLLLLAAFDLGQGLEWWQDGVIYQVYPRSYQDTDGNGIGDIKGITGRLDYIKSLNVSAVWLSPVYKSPMADFGYDISDFKDIDPLFGTMDDMDELIDEAEARGMGIIMDMVPNHSSDEHDFFIRSVNREDPYTDYYVWRPASGVNGTGHPTPPNNWLSVFGGSAWTWREERQEFYLHQFHYKQPDFNYRNPLVIEEIKDILTFWLDRGIYGFRWDAVTHMFEDPSFPDEPLSGNPVSPDDYNYLSHIYTQNLPETPYTLSLFKKHMDDYTEFAADGIHRCMFLEIWNPVEETMEYYRNVSDFPFNFRFLTLMNSMSNGREAESAILGWVNNMPEGSWANWVLGNHDITRVGTRLDMFDGALMNNMLLPGTAIIYYGEELGMTDTYIPPEQIQDPAGYRDPERTPMQWDASQYAGFSSAEPWLPVNENHVWLNVDAQETGGESMLKVFRTLVSLRYQPAIQLGELHTTVVGYEWVLAYARVTWDVEELSFLVVVNWSKDQTLTIDLSPGAFGSFPCFEITETQGILRTVGSSMDLENFDISNFVMEPRAGVVVGFTPVALSC